MFSTNHFLEIDLDGYNAKILLMKVKDVLKIHYVAVRGRDNEQGAVQRVLSPIRLDAIEKYILKGHSFYSPFYLNWNNQEYRLSVNNEGILSIPLIEDSAQVIDGQHRLAGLSRAMLKDPTIGDKEILVIISENLETVDAAKIFININTEQRPVPKSLIYDLFGMINENDADQSIIRAKDIADRLQEDKTSPLFGYIKYPGQKRGVGKIDLSTVVNAIQPHVTADGTFNQKKLFSFEIQYAVIQNFFSVIKSVYDEVDLWENKTKNPFLSNAGFHGAIEALCEEVINKCVEKKSFTIQTIAEVLNLDHDVITRDSIAGMEGRSQRKRIKEYIILHLNDQLPEEDEYSF